MTKFTQEVIKQANSDNVREAVVLAFFLTIAAHRLWVPRFGPNQTGEEKTAPNSR